MYCALRSYRWTARLSPARLGPRIPQLPLDGTAVSGTAGIASGHSRSIAKHCSKNALRRVYEQHIPQLRRDGTDVFPMVSFASGHSKAIAKQRSTCKP